MGSRVRGRWESTRRQFSWGFRHPHVWQNDLAPAGTEQGLNQKDILNGKKKKKSQALGTSTINELDP